MIRSLNAAAVFSGALMVGILLGTTANLSRAYADAVPGGMTPIAKSEQQVPIDPKKKMPGDACKTSDECQSHHTCTKIGEKSVCQAPPRARLPPGAVT